jgi:hypothetical protein
MTTSSINQTKGHHYTQQDFIDGALEVAELFAEGVSIKIYKKWWGYTIELNANAVSILEKCLKFLEETIGDHFKGEIPRLISFCIQFKKDRLVQAVDAKGSGGFVRMVSPWVIPFALAVVRGASRDDQNLWFTVWDEVAEKWAEDAEFNECLTRNSPALAQHGDFLYCVHRGCDNDSQLWWTKYSTNDGWSDDTVFPNHHTELNPSLVDFQNNLYCFHRGPGDDHALYYCTFDSGKNTWHDDTKIAVGTEYFYSNTGCAVAVFNGDLHLVYQLLSQTNNNEFRHLIFDGKTKAWRKNTINPKGWTADTPALVAYQDKLLMVHRGDGDQGMYYATYDGSWSEDLTVPGTSSLYGPGLAVFGDKVFMAHRGHKDDKLLYYFTYKDSKWIKEDTKIPDIYTGAPPALACYTDPQCKADNYVDHETAKPRLICVHRGWG